MAPISAAALNRNDLRSTVRQALRSGAAEDDTVSEILGRVAAWVAEQADEPRVNGVPGSYVFADEARLAVHYVAACLAKAGGPPPTEGAQHPEDLARHLTEEHGIPDWSLFPEGAAMEDHHTALHLRPHKPIDHHHT